MTKGIPNKYTDKQLAFLEENRVMPRQELTDLFNYKFRTAYSKELIRNLCKRKGWHTGRNGKFKKGQDAWNKGTVGLMRANSGSWTSRTSLKWNKKPLGYERINTDGYTMLKVAEPNKFRLKHNVIWEQVNGNIPIKHVIRFKDGNKSNFELNNLICIPLGVNARLNKQYKYSEANSSVKPILITMAQIDQKIYEKGKI